MVLFQIAAIIFGFVLLVKSASEAVTRLVRLSRHFGMSEFAISFVVVGVVAIFPELSIGISSALSGAPSFGLGIIFGSNIADLTLVVGIVALVSNGIKLHHDTIKKTKWFLIFSALPVLMLSDGSISPFESFVLIMAFVVYATMMLRTSHTKNPPGKKGSIHMPREIAALLISLGVLLIAGNIITVYSKELSVALSLPLFFVGMIVAIGTCLPELTFAIEAANKKHGELGFGNILGNVLADCMITIGIIGMISPIRPENNNLALMGGIFMVLSAAVIVLLFDGKNIISRKQGALLVLLYAVFLSLQIVLEKLITG